MRLFGIPLLAVVVLAVTIAIALMLERTVLGRSIEAVGQNDRAAGLAGLRVELTRFWAYVICAALAGLAGALISGFSGGNSLDRSTFAACFTARKRLQAGEKRCPYSCAVKTNTL